MNTKSLSSLIGLALADIIDYDELKNYGKKEWWDKNERLACAYALRKIKTIDWQAYLENNTDIKQANIDPVLHFIDNGVFEGRKIIKREHKEKLQNCTKIIINKPDCKNHSIQHNNDKRDKAIKTDNTSILNDAIHFWLYNCPDNISEYFLEILIKRYGIIDFMNTIKLNFNNNKLLIAKKLCKFHNHNIYDNDISHVGIYYTILLGGGAENVVIQLAHSLLDMGYKVSLFLGFFHPNDLRLDKRINIIYLNSQPSSNGIINQISQLYHYLSKTKVDLMLYHECWDTELVWIIFLHKIMEIPAILFHHSAFYRNLYYHSDIYSFSEKCFLYANFNKLICLSSISELFFRSHGVDACYIPNPISIEENYHVNDITKRPHTIAVLGRLADSRKQIMESIKIFNEVIKYKPNSYLILIGSFLDKEKEDIVKKYLQENKLEHKVTITGWVSDPNKYLDRSTVLLSTSWTEAFPLSIGEAQARGLPVVMYDTPIELEKNNASIIRVPQLDYKAASTEILNIFNDDNLLQKLSLIAIQNTAKYSLEKYNNAIDNLLKTFSTESKYKKYTYSDYRKLFQTITFYGGIVPPWERKQL